ncbi:MAG: 30S ribosomal protein S6 [Deltaproteobacteria bacterium]|nr:30S ribosomal protein S6 [Deltaproteobacteria bacterium]
MWAREYELIYIARPDLSDEELATIFDRTSKIITDREGHILTVDEWGKKKLAYEIKKYAKGHFVYVLFLGDPSIVDEVERTFRLDDGLLRFLTVKLGDRVHVADRLSAAKEEALARAAAAEAGAEGAAEGAAAGAAG